LRVRATDRIGVLNIGVRLHQLRELRERFRALVERNAQHPDIADLPLSLERHPDLRS
jgi:hypothetical protein